MAGLGTINARQHTMSNGRNRARNTPGPVTTSTPAAPMVPPPEVPQAPAVVQTETEPLRTPSGRILELHRCCPLCWNRSKGFGTSYSTAPNGRTYYKCDQTMSEEHPPCGHTWSIVINAESVVITHRTVELDGKR